MVQNDLYDTVGLEWHCWEEAKIREKVDEPDIWSIGSIGFTSLCCG
jgi:hypothetical protein